jgi:hypothetical protein
MAGDGARHRPIGMKRLNSETARDKPQWCVQARTERSKEDAPAIAPTATEAASSPPLRPGEPFIEAINADGLTAGER